MSEVDKYTDDEVMPAVHRLLNEIPLGIIRQANWNLGDKLLASAEEGGIVDGATHLVWSNILSYCENREVAEDIAS